MTEFEYDPVKSQYNKEKHGLDFEEAKALWIDEDRIIYPARTETESRFVILAKRTGKIWAGIFTIRGGQTRIISVRRARQKEEMEYESRRPG